MISLGRLGGTMTRFFVDDAFLGGATLASVLAAGLCRAGLNTRPLLAGAVLAGGCFLALTLSVVRAAARPPN
jgi:hypothetical protein